MGDGYVKIYGDRLRNSSLWLESWQARLVFVEMLALANRSGWVNTPSVRVLANALNLSVADTEAGLAVLEAPDPDSRTSTEDGRRLIRSQGGWQIVNYQYYREYRTEKQEADRLRAIENRRKAKGELSGSATVVDASVESATVSDESQRPRRVALPASASLSASEISQISEKRNSTPACVPAREAPQPAPWSEPGESVGWTAQAQRTAFVAAFEASQRTTPGMGGKAVGSFHADVLRTAELQGVEPGKLFRDTLARWLGAGLDETARRAPYACFQAAWGGLTSKGPSGPPAGPQAPQTASAARAAATEAMARGDMASVTALITRARELEDAEERRRGRR